MNGSGTVGIDMQPEACDGCDEEFEVGEKFYSGTIDGKPVVVCEDCTEVLDRVCDKCFVPIFGEAAEQACSMQGKLRCSVCIDDPLKPCANCGTPNRISKLVDSLCPECSVCFTDTGHHRE